MPDARPAIGFKNILAMCIFGGSVLLIPNIVQSASSNSATLQWAANLESDLAGYRIYHGTTPGIYGVPQIVGKTTTYQYNNLDTNKTHYFAITAYDTAGNESLPSSEVSKTISPASSQTVANTSTGSNGQTEPNTHTNSGGNGLPLLLTPSAGSTLPGATATFTWTANGASLTDWALRMGSSPGDHSLYNSGNLSSGTLAHTVSGLSTNGTTVWVRLQWRYTNGTWGSTDVSYLTATGSGNNNSTNSNTSTSSTTASPIGKPILLTPASGSTLPGATATFTWTANGASLTDWALRMGTSPGDHSLYNSGNLSSGTLAHTVSGLSTNGTTVWVRLQWRYTNGTWGSTDVSYHTATGSGSNAGKGQSPVSTKVIWRNTTSGEVAVWLMNGLTITSVGFPGSSSTDWRIEQAGDMNGDGQVDVLWRNANSGVVAIWLMNEGTIISSGFLGGVPSEWVVKGLGDVNGDNKADVLWRNSKNGMVAVWLMNGLTITSVGFLGSTPTAWDLEMVGDMNGDGKADLVWQNQTNGTVAVWLMNGLTITSVGFPASTSREWKIQSVGDVNGDGKADVIWRHRDTGMVAVWLMNGSKIVSYNFLGGVPFEWEIKQVSDMNGDGKADVVLQNQMSGKVAVWLMNGLNINSVGFPGSTPVNWKIYR